MVFTSRSVKRVVDVTSIADTSITTGEEKTKNQIKKMDENLLLMVKENSSSHEEFYTFPTSIYY